MKIPNLIAMTFACLVGFCIFQFEKKEVTVSQTDLPQFNMIIGARDMSSNQSVDSQLSNEQDAEWLEEYESNGPQGVSGVLMRSLTCKQFALVVFVFISSSGIAAYAVKNKPGLQDHE
jgi:hypothetical protein